MERHVYERTDEYLSGLLDSATQQAYERHVAVCFRCRRAMHEAQEAKRCMELLLPTEPPPPPSPDFYRKVWESVERQRARGWLGSLVVALHPRLAYPLVLLGLLLGAWTLTYDTPGDTNAGLLAMEFPDGEFTRILAANPTADRAIGQDLVMMSLVGLPEDTYQD